MKFKTVWSLAKHVSEEVFLESQLEAAGSQRARIIDRYAQNMGGARSASNTVKFMTAFMLGYLAFMPAIALSQIKGIPVTPATAPLILFVASVSLAIYQGMALFFTLFLKLMTMSSFTTGNAFKFLGLLPISKRNIAIIANVTNLRMNIIDIVVFTITMPVIGLLINGSWAFFLVNIATCTLVILFANSLIVVLGNSLGRIIARSGTGSRTATFVRVLTSAGYAAGFLLVFMLMMYGITSIESLLNTGFATIGQMNGTLPAIPFPFAGAYMASLMLIPAGMVDPAVIAMAAAGFLALLGIVAITARASMKVLQHVGSAEPENVPAGKAANRATQVKITTRTPLKALIKQEFTTITREYGNMITYMLAIVMPVILFAMGLFSEPVENVGWASGATYIGFQVYSVHAAVSAGEEKLGGTIAALPVKARDVFNARRFAMYLNQIISTGIAMGIVLLLASDPWPILAAQTVLLSFALVSVPLFLLLYARAFCRVNGRVTMFPATMSNKAGKLIGILVLIYAITFIELFLVEINSKGMVSTIVSMIADLSGLWNAKDLATPGTAAAVIVAVWIVNAAIAIALEIIASRVFDERKGKYSR